MKPRFARNISNQGRLIRGLAAMATLVAAWFGFRVSLWLGIGLVALGCFTLFEALRGWCALRACGIKTRF